MKIGVFDSGIGAQRFADVISAALPDAELLVREDKEHMPYGNKSAEQLLALVTPIFTEMVARGCSVIVVACNTVSTTIITDLRQRFTIPLIALDPMLKPAVKLTKTGVIAVCATPTTIASKRYNELKNEFAATVKVVEPDCSDWASMIEVNNVDAEKIETRITYALDQNADVIVLACTHYHWIEEDIARLSEGKAVILQPEQAIVSRLLEVIEASKTIDKKA